MQNQHFVQTEVRLLLGRGADKDKGKAKNKNKNKKSKKKKKKTKKASAALSSTDPNPNPSPNLPLPPAAPPTGAQRPVAAPSCPPSSCVQLDAHFLDGHHRCVLAALLLAPQTLTAAACRRPASPPQPQPLCVVVGLGGGALPMALRRSLPQLRRLEILGSMLAIVCTDHGGKSVMASGNGWPSWTRTWSPWPSDGSASARTSNICSRCWATARRSFEGSEWNWTPRRRTAALTRPRPRATARARTATPTMYDDDDD